MRVLRSRSLVLLALLCAALPAAAQEKWVWPAVPPEDLTLKDNPAMPGSSAMVLLKRDSRDDAKGLRELYVRIKVFNDKGRSHGNIDIPYVPKWFELKEIQARVIQPDGRIVPYSGPIYEKTLLRQRKQRVMAKTLSLPDLKAGSILEYRWVGKLKPEAAPSRYNWLLQDDLFVRELQLELRPGRPGFSASRPTILRYSVPQDKEMIEATKGVLSVKLNNLPPFEEEPYMPPRESAQMRYMIRYPSFWGLFGMQGYVDYYKKYIGKSNDYVPIVRQLVSPQDTAEVKLDKLYRAVQDRIRNLSYEESYTKKERKREGLKERKKAIDVWNLQYGTADEIVPLFVGLCRGAGFVAEILAVAQRDDSLYDSNIPLIDQLDGQIAVVNLPEGSRYFDPGTRFAPAGWIGWQNQGVHGYRVGEDSYTQTKVPLQGADKNARHREIRFRVQADGSAAVVMTTTYSGEEAISRRNDFFDVAGEQREIMLRDELEGLYPHATVNEVKWEGMDDASDTARLTFRFDLPQFAQVTASRLLLRPRFYEVPMRFTNWKRIHPIYVRQSATYTRVVRVEPPPNHDLEFEPQPFKHADGFGSIESTFAREGGVAVVRTRVTLEASLLREAEHHAAIKRFFDYVSARNRTHLVVKRPLTASGGGQ